MYFSRRLGGGARLGDAILHDVGDDLVILRRSVVLRVRVLTARVGRGAATHGPAALEMVLPSGHTSPISNERPHAAHPTTNRTAEENRIAFATY